MKLALVVLIALAAVASTNAKPDLTAMKTEVYALLRKAPIGELYGVLKKHMHSNPEFKEIVLYLQGSKWKRLVESLSKNPTVIEFMAFLREHEIPVESILRLMRNVVANIKPTGSGKRTMVEFLLDINAIVPYDKIAAFIKGKIDNDPNVKELFDKLSEEKYQELFRRVRHLDDVQSIIKQLQEYKIDVNQFIAYGYSVVGWKE